MQGDSEASRGGPVERRDGREIGGRFLCDTAGNPLGFDRAVEILTGWEVGAMLGAPEDPAASGPAVRGLTPPEPGAPCDASLVLGCGDGSQLEVKARVTAVGSGRLVAVEIRQVLARIPAPRSGSQYGLDPLTRVLLPEAFAEQLSENFAVARRLGHPLALVLVDVDHMTAINDECGFEAGNTVLRRVAGILQASLRQGDVVARAGGDDFTVLLRGVGRGQARHVGGRLRQAVERFTPVALGGTRLVTVSIGVACYPADGTSADELMKRAQQALAEARRLGRNRVWCYQRRPRVAIDVPVWVAGFEAEPIGVIKDLSNSGVFVETAQDLPVDLRVGLSFTLPGDDSPVRVIGRIARRVLGAGKDHPSAGGLGIEFESYGELERARLEAFLHRTLTT